MAKTELSRAVSSDISVPTPDGLELLPYQRAGVAYALARSGTLIADEMGLGKTIQAIGVINAHASIRTVVVISPASLKLNWKNEIDRWCTRQHHTTIFPELPSSDDCEVTIINYDQLKKLAENSWDLVIVDEAHYAKNPKSQRTKYVQAIARRCKKKILLTGTPILNKPVELWPILQIVAPDEWDPPGFTKGRQVAAGEGAGFFRFVKRFCDAKEVWHGRVRHWDFSGSSNLPELQEKLRTTCMIRRLKSEALPDLPAKRRQVIALDSPTSDGEGAAFRALDCSYEEAVGQLSGKQIQFAELSAARHKTALLKCTAAIEHIAEVLESSAKIVVFGHHRDVIDALYSGLSGFGAVVVTGETPIEERQHAVERFQSDPTCRVIIGSIGAMGVGHTLTAASHVVFVELSWVPAELTQAEDRCHRIGQRECVLVQHLVTNGSIDARMARLVLEKQEIADMALDDETIAANVQDRQIVSSDDHYPKISDFEKAEIHGKLRFLAERCDGAVAKDGEGFNGSDSHFGKTLARQENLSARQAVFAKRMLVKYAKQLSKN